MIAWWQQLAARERAMLGWGGLLSVLLLGYALVWAPLQDSRVAWRERAMAADASLRWMQSTAQGLQGMTRAPVTVETEEGIIVPPVRLAREGVAVGRVDQDRNRVVGRLFA